MEFPKMLYRNGALDGQTLIVHSQEEQDTQKANAFLPLGEQPEEQQPSKGSK